ncbi:sensor histidine kinase [Parafrankia elaeagni]|uniref:sensor histidine kinase n=1 Tax=Parafrankia elaeagni TaxID=222534 RepID=UPI00036D7588|nr:HAMP domain-containing sensor histidine kinase [Parafrankia elaeagni]
MSGPGGGGSWIEPSGSWATAERTVLRRARLRIGVVVGVLITLLVALVSWVAYSVLVHAQNDQIERELRYTLSYGTPTAPPVCAWLFALDDARVTAGPVPAPPGFPLRADLDATAVSGTPSERAVSRNGTRYVVRTQARGDGAVQAVFDTRYQLSDRRHLLIALLVVSSGSVVVAIAAGVAVSRHAVAPLAEALATQRRFVTDASHELRTPITVAYTRVQVLIRRGAASGLPADHLRGLEQLAATVRRLGEVVDDLLLSARLVGSAAEPRREPVDLAGVVDAAVAAEADRLAEQQVTLDFQRPAEPLFVDGVASALRRAVDELLTNAVNHTPAGGRIVLALGRSHRGRWIELTVADNGDGFDSAAAERLFDRFYRGPGGRERRAGLGLGLALMREVVAGHRGTIEAVGRPGQGATFTLRLPESTDRLPEPADAVAGPRNAR